METYLPKLMDKREVEEIAHAEKEKLGIMDVTKKGMLMSALMKELKGKADGTMVKKLLTHFLIYPYGYSKPLKNLIENYQGLVYFYFSRLIVEGEFILLATGILFTLAL